MAINPDKAFETNDSGVLLTDSNGAQTLYLTSGSGAPSAVAPINSWYMREDTQQLYYNWDGTASGWRVFRENQITRSNPSFQTTNSVFETALSIDMGTVPAGTYRVGWSYRSNNSKINTDNETQVAFNGLAVVTNTSFGSNVTAGNLGGGLGEQFSGFADFTVLSIPVVVSIDIRRTAGNGGSRVNTMNLEVWRID